MTGIRLPRFGFSRFGYSGAWPKRFLERAAPYSFAAGLSPERLAVRDPFEGGNFVYGTAQTGCETRYGTYSDGRVRDTREGFWRCDMETVAKAKFGCVVHGAASYTSKQGSVYAPGISKETVGSEALFLGTVRIPPQGRTKATYS